MQIGTISKAFFAKPLIMSQYIVSSKLSVQHYELRFTPVNTTVVLTSSFYHLSISHSTMPSSTKVTSTSKLSTKPRAKTILTNKAVYDSSDRDTSMDIMKKEKKQIIEPSHEENEEEKEKEKKYQTITRRMI